MKQVIDQIIVGKVERSVRLYDFLVGRSILLPSRKSVKKALSNNRILLNGKQGLWDDELQEKDIIKILESEEKQGKVFPLKIDVLFEDDHMAILNKPAGYPVSGNYYKTVQNCLPFNLKRSNEKDATEIFKPIHRLDNPTSGLLIVAKTLSSRVKLGRLLERGEISKNYLAIVQGEIAYHSKIKFSLDGKKSYTDVRLMSRVKSLRSDYLSQVHCELLTGRTHQIRRHLSMIGHPVLGDKEYGKEGNIMKNKGLFLCAYQLRLEHPITSEKLFFEIEPPNKFQKVLVNEERQYHNYHSG